MPLVSQTHEHDAFLQTLYLAVRPEFIQLKRVHKHPLAALSLLTAQAAAGTFNVTLTSIREKLRNCLGLWGYMLFRLSITFN